MKRIFLFFISFLLVTSMYGYDIKKDFDYTYAPDYTIKATNESTYYEDSDGNKKYYDTVVVMDYKSSIIYRWYCSTETDALKKYRELISEYTSSYQIKKDLIPLLEAKVVDVNTSDNGKWMYCSLGETIETDYSDISEEKLLELFTTKLDEHVFTDEDIMEIIAMQFDSFEDFLNVLFGEASPKEITDEAVILIMDKYLKTEENAEKLEKITNSVDEKQSNFDSYMQYAKQIDDISNLGKQKKFSKKIELEPKDYETLTQYAKKGIVADKEIYERDTRIENLRNTLNRWIEKYDGLVEKTKDYFHAIKLAPQRVADFFKTLFDKEKQDELERQRIEQEKLEAERKAREEAREKERLEKKKLKNSPEYKKRRASYER